MRIKSQKTPSSASSHIFVTWDTGPALLQPLCSSTHVERLQRHRDATEERLLSRPPAQGVFQLRLQTVWNRASHPFCVRHKFLTHRIHAHKKCSFDATDFGGHCYTTRVTGTDANSEPISMVREERRNQKAGGGCTSDYRAVCWPN